MTLEFYVTTKKYTTLASRDRRRRSKQKNIEMQNSRQKELFKFGEVWFNAAADLESLDILVSRLPSGVKAGSEAEPVPQPVVKLLKEIADNILEVEAGLSDSKQEGLDSSDRNWAKTVMKSGTLTDKISALAMSTSESYIHHYKRMDQLMVIAKKKSPRESLLAVDALKSIFIGADSGVDSVLPPDRKCRFFHEQPDIAKMVALLQTAKIISSSESEDAVEVLKDLSKISTALAQHLCLWTVEDHVKRCYFQWIVCLDALSKNPVSNIRNRTLNHAWEMLATKPEQERTLLTYIVNKFGDLDKKIASKVVFLLLKLIERHHVMKLSIVKEVEQLIYRDGITARTKYYALVFLNQITFHAASKFDKKCALYLCGVYFKLFELLSNIDGGKPNKTAAKKKKTAQDEQVMDKIISAILAGISRAYPYARSKSNSQAENNEVDEFFNKNIDSLFKAVHLQSCSFKTSVQALHIIYRLSFVESSEGTDEPKETVLSEKMASRFCRALYAVLLSLRLNDSSKTMGLFLNLVFKTLRNCPENDTVIAVLKRTLQTTLTGLIADNPAFVNGALVAVSEAIKEHGDAKIRALFLESVTTNHTSLLVEDDEEERFVDAVEDGDETSANPSAGNKKVDVSEFYDPFNRTPEASKAAQSCNWELAVLSQHYHPTTKLFAQTLLGKNREKQKFINYPSDPLVDFTTSRFLDKFVYRNPKKGKQTEDAHAHANKPDAAVSRLTHNDLILNRNEQMPASVENWHSKVASGSVAADEMFFATFFANSNRQRSTKKPINIEDETVDDIDGEANENAIEQAIMGSFPERNQMAHDSDGDDEPVFDEVEDADLVGSQQGEDDDDEFDDDMFGLDDEDGSEMGEDDDMSSQDDEDEDSDNEQDQVPSRKSKPQKKKASAVDLDQTLRKAIKNKDISENVFASLEDYAHLLEQDGDSITKENNANESTASRKEKRKFTKQQGRNGKRSKR